MTDTAFAESERKTVARNTVRPACGPAKTPADLLQFTNGCTPVEQAMVEVLRGYPGAYQAVVDWLQEAYDEKELAR